MYWEYIVCSQYMGGLKWKPCYKKSRALASARVPPLLHTYIGPIRWVCVFIPVDICNTVFWLAANIYGINAVAFWLEDMCVPQDALIGWEELWIMQFCIPDAMHKQQQMCAAYTSQNSLFHQTRPAFLAAKPLEESSAQRPPSAEKCKYGAIVQLCQKWLQFPQFGQGSLNYFQCGSSLARIRGSGNPPSLQLGHPGISLKK